MPAEFVRRRVFAVGLAVLAVLPACNEQPPAIVAAKSFASAVRSRDPQAVLSMVDRTTVEYAERLAERASDQIGGRRSVDPSEMLQVVDVPPHFAVVGAELVSESADTARVRLQGADGETHEIDLVLEGTAWKVVLPTPRELPRAPAAQKDEAS